MEKENTLFWFNPEADMALASNSPYYMMPGSAQRMASDLAVLPIWLQKMRQGYVVAPAEDDWIFCQQTAQLFGTKAMPISLENIDTYTHAGFGHPAEICVWGWNRAMRKRLIDAGVNEANLPDETMLEYIRTIAGRPWAATWLQQMPDWQGLQGQMDVLTDVKQCRTYSQANGPCVLKAPWSGSGKGLMWCREGMTDALEGWCARVIRSQGCVVASPIYNKVCDFSMLYARNHDGTMEEPQISLFDTDSRGAYRHTRLMSQAAACQQLAQWIPADLLHRVKHYFAQRIESLFHETSFLPYAGVDMMICHSAASGYTLHPCVEINARCTMGFIATDFFRQYVSPQSEGTFCVQYFPTPQDLRQWHEQQTNETPAVINHGRLLQGYRALTPVGKNTQYLASVYVEPIRP